MKILFIHPFQLRLQRGIEVYLWNLAVALAKADIEVDILTWDGPLNIPIYAQHPAIHLHRVPSVRYFQDRFAIPFYAWHLLRGKYGHVFVNFAGYGEGVALRLARLIRSVDFSVVFHFPRSQVPHRYREFERWGFQRNSKHLIAVSQSTAGEVQGWAGRPCEVIGHGVNTDRFRPDAQARFRIRNQLDVPADAPILISAAALEERKGIQWVVAAMPGVLEKFPTVRYWILGDGPYRMDLEKRVRDLGLKNSVSFLGFQKDVAPYLAASDIALLLSRGEASPVSLLEFASSGLPVITSHHEPFPELVQPDWAQMVSEQDVAQVCQAILVLLSDNDLRKRKGSRAREFVAEYHQWSQVAGQYKSLIEVNQ